MYSQKGISNPNARPPRQGAQPHGRQQSQPYVQQQYGQPPHGQPAYGAPPPHGQPPPQRQPQHVQPPHGQAPPQRQPQQYGQPPHGQPPHGQVPPQQYMQQQRHSQRNSQKFLPMFQPPEDTKEDDEKRQQMEAKKREIAKNVNIHFNYFDEAQYGIANFPKQLAEIGVVCVAQKKNAKILVVGCGAGRAVFEMAKHADIVKVDGIDIDEELINVANTLKTTQNVQWEIQNHGDIIERYKVTAFKDLKIEKAMLGKCNFETVKDLHTIPLSFSRYDCIIVMNVLDKLHSAKTFVNTIQRRVNKPGGVLIFSECFDWNEEITHKEKWIGGMNNKSSSDALKELLARSFTVIKEDKVPFVERQNAFLFKLCIANTVIFKSSK